MDQPSYTYEDEDEYEYEYEDTETETFLVDLDLSSLNPPTKSNVPGAPKPAVPAKRPLDRSDPQRGTPDRDAPTPNMAEPVEDEGRDLQDRPSTPFADVEDHEGEDGVSPFSTHVQILDLSSSNPIISYLGQVYSCTWTDMIGTNMFFTKPGTANAAATMQSTDDYDLLGMSRIKLVGDRASVSQKARPKQDPHGEDDYAEGQPTVQEDEPSGRSLGRLIHSNPKNNARIKKQATFLEKLMDLKRQRGETDIVRTYVDEAIASNNSLSLPQTIHSEIEELNRRVIKGDAEALARLQEVYSRSENQDTELEGMSRGLQEEDG
ncbi:hypothetical protein A1O1_04415 [Capronia coronata CBS 617.96]|uniref:Transcription factor TFIIIC triple barrel domain-containing protein n=1 Tax=Capronia coronata CBS 617.96 TaxID=1182541 RepID=W9YNP6_9EURO|nr:uncharacterized protein A1O1_04415 [Capronia coronata CBS 617.96]EXJ91305.1 hypothetical protein A1O1_04415 [Capronia coronata CBS 617.96]